MCILVRDPLDHLVRVREFASHRSHCGFRRLDTMRLLGWGWAAICVTIEYRK